MLDQENDGWPLLSTIHETLTQELPVKISKTLKNVLENSRQIGKCGDVPWPCFDYETASQLLFKLTPEGIQKNTHEQQNYYYGGTYQQPWDMSKLWTWALAPELLITWVCLAIFLGIVGCCWICTQLSDWLCKIAVILCLTTVLVSVILAFSASV